jgi:hypothetical protein
MLGPPRRGLNPRVQANCQPQRQSYGAGLRLFRQVGKLRWIRFLVRNPTRFLCRE